MEEGESQQKKLELFTEPGFTEPIIALLKRILSCWECEDKTQVASTRPESYLYSVKSTVECFMGAQGGPSGGFCCTPPSLLGDAHN